MFKIYSLCCVKSGKRCFWKVVFRKDGRQKMTRVAFADSMSALIYAMRVERRLAGMKMANV